MNGIFIIDKPGGMTSHDVVNAIRKKFSVKAGHLGTLDPMATGVLPITVGKATRVAQYIAASFKVYTGSFRFGFATDTYDREGTPAGAERPLQSSSEEIGLVMRSLTGVREQVPPSFSAKKIGGVESYKLARKGRAVALVPAIIEVREFEMTGFEPPFMNFRIACSGGTYIRSLAHELGELLGCGAHLYSLRREDSSGFGIAQAVALDQVAPRDLIRLESLLESWPRIEVSGNHEERVAHGNPVPAETTPGFARIFNKKGEFIAIAAVENGWALPRLVLTSTGILEKRD